MRVSIASPLMQPSPNGRRVGIRIVTFEACSGFTHVTARRIAQPPKAAFVTRLQPCRLPGRAARQLPDQSTTLWVESSSTSDPRLRGALPKGDIGTFPLSLNGHHIATLLRFSGTANKKLQHKSKEATMTKVASIRPDHEMTCKKCGDALIAPEWSEYVSEQLVLNI